MTKPRILMIAYACDPKGVGEHWLGWGWAEQAAKDYEVELLTRPHGGQALLQSAADAGIVVHTLSVPGWWWRATQPLGSLGSWLRIFCWQKRALQFARWRHLQAPFALVHQTTFHSFRAPFLASSLGIPSVWGPVAGGEAVPKGFGNYLGRHRFEEKFRCLANHFFLLLPSVSKSLARTDVLIASNRTTLNFLPTGIRNRAVIIPANANSRSLSEVTARPCRVDDTFSILYAGNCVARRGIALALEALARLSPQNYHFYVAGSGSALESWRSRATELGLQDRVTFTGQISRTELDALYEKADVFLFPSLRDSGGSGLLEAMEKQVPVVCLDWGGPAEMVAEGTGLKVQVGRPQDTVRNLTDALASLRDDPGQREKLATAARAQIAKRFSWEEKRRLLVEIYNRLLCKS